MKFNYFTLLSHFKQWQSVQVRPSVHSCIQQSIQENCDSFFVVQSVDHSVAHSVVSQLIGQSSDSAGTMSDSDMQRPVVQEGASDTFDEEGVENETEEDNGLGNTCRLSLVANTKHSAPLRR